MQELELNISFSDALNVLKRCEKIHNPNWYKDFSGREDHPLPVRWIEIQFPDHNSKMTEPYFVFCEDECLRIPYFFTTEEILTSRWRVGAYSNSY